MGLDVSVVIPTHNRRALLVGCLEALAGQSLGRECFEVLVVSDGSSDGTPEAARAEGERLGLQLEVLEPPHGGPASARNHGIARARADIVAFTDDDVRASEAWLEAGLEPFREPSVAGVEGLTRAELGSACLYRLNLENLEGGLYPTCNMFYRRRVLDELGGFDAGYHRYSDDSDMAWRVLDAGHRIEFAARAAVVHLSHSASPRLPLGIAAQLPDSMRLWARHPARPRLRPWIYRSDLAKIALALGALALGLVGWWLPAALAALGFLGLVLRTLASEVILDRVAGPGTLLELTAVYALLPFVNVYQLARGWLGRGRLK